MSSYFPGPSAESAWQARATTLSMLNDCAIAGMASEGRRARGRSAGDRHASRPVRASLDQKLEPTLSITILGRIGTIDSMNCAEDVNMLALLLNRLLL